MKPRKLTQWHIAAGGSASPQDIGQGIPSNAALEDHRAAHHSRLILGSTDEEGANCKVKKIYSLSWENIERGNYTN